MSVESSGSRPPESNSATAGSAAEKPDSEAGVSLGELPAPEEKVREFLDEMGEVAHREICTTHGRELRAECVRENTRPRIVESESGGKEIVDELQSREPVEMWQAVAEMLEWHENYHKSELRLEYGLPGDEFHKLLDVPLENSWMAAYQKQERARLKALERETCGYESCQECETRWCQDTDEHETEWVSGRYERPVVVLTGRTASSRGRASADHAREITDAWSGENGSDGARRALRYVMKQKLGLGNEEFVRWSQGEPHPGGKAGSGYGTNSGFHHAHDAIIFDLAAADVEEVSPAAFRSVIEAHVEKCPGAGREAHDLDIRDWEAGADDVDTVVVKEVDGEIEESVASYVASYLSNDEKDLLERSPEYLMWAATMWATGTRKASGTDSRTHAIEADKCKHKHQTDEQGLAHGEKVVRSSKRGYTVECLACGSPWEVEQTETVTEARLGGEAAACDGGEGDTEEALAESELRSRWPSARAAAKVGGEPVKRECDHDEPDSCPLCASETESPNHTVSGEVPIPDSASVSEGCETVVAGFERPPRWRATAVIREGEELPASGGGGVDKRPLKLESAPEMVVGMAARSAGVVKCLECRSVFDDLAGYLEHECAGVGQVGVGWVGTNEAPAEETVMDASGFVEAIPDRLREESGGGENSSSRERVELPAEVVSYVENQPQAGVTEILGRFGLAPDMKDRVAVLVDE